MNISNCRSGELTIEAPQHEIDNFLSGVKGRGIRITRSATNKPTPLGIPKMDFPPLRKVESGEAQDDRVRILNVPRADGKPEPLPSYDLDYAPLKKVVGN